MIRQIKIYFRRIFGPKLTKKIGLWNKNLFGIKADPVELKYINQILEFVQPGTTVLDIGANVGIWTTVLSKKVGFNGKVFAFEPIESTFSLLKKRCLKLKNVDFFKVALSNENGVKQIYVDPYAAAPPDASINNTAKHINSTRRQKLIVIQVEVAKLDSLSFPINGRVSFMKIDVEGHEAAVIEGALSLIKKNQPVIFMEILREQWPQNNPEATEVVEKLKNLGYTFGQVLPERIEFDFHHFDLRYENFLFIPTNS